MQANLNIQVGEKAAARLGKNPEAHTDFLPDRDREKYEEATRKQIELEYEIRQQVYTELSCLKLKKSCDVKLVTTEKCSQFVIINRSMFAKTKVRQWTWRFS